MSQGMPPMLAHHSDGRARRVISASCRRSVPDRSGSRGWRCEAHAGPVACPGMTTGVMEALGAAWEAWPAHDDAYVVDGENVVVLARYTARHKTGGKALNAGV